MISNFFYAEVGGGIIILLILIRQAFTINENRNLYKSARNEIAQREKIEKNLIKSRKHFKKIFDNSPIGIFHSSIEGKFIEVNKALADMLKYESPEELISMVNRGHISNIYVERDKRSRIIEEALIDTEWHFYENEFYRKDGSIMTSELSFRLIRDQGESPKYMEGFIVDITERKKAENYMKNSLKEKELLLKEIHHRVKNNIQIITSMLDLQKYFVDQQETITILTESQNRVKSMATIHEMLNQSDLININFSDYIYNLVSELCYTYSLKFKINPIIDVGEIYLNIETAIPCGLIINELVSNSLKYAFPDHKDGEIKIELKEQKDRELTLIVSDNGIGFPGDLDYKDVKTSLGLKLVNMLIDQIDGTIELDRSQGTKFIIKFRELEYKKRF
jgi:PAS domain S-box-containing protein